MTERSIGSNIYNLDDLDPSGTLFEISDTDEYLAQRLEEETDKLGNVTLARERLGLPHVGADDDTAAQVRTISAGRKPRVSRRGGRSYEEPSDNDLDPAMKIKRVPTDEERARNTAAINGIRRASEARKPKELTPEEIQAQREAEVAEMRRQVRESWGDLL